MECGEAIASTEIRFGLDPKAEYDQKALDISGISWEEIKGMWSPADAYSQAYVWIKQTEAQSLPVVSHNAVFDAGFISELIYRQGAYDRSLKIFVPAFEIVTGPWYCTRRMIPDSWQLPDKKLDTLARRFGFSRTTDKHGALEDAILCGKCFWEMVK